MSEQTKIAWCDSTVNFWEGCTKVSAGCANCYAKARDDRQLIEKVSHFGKGAPRRKSKSAVKDALAFNRTPWICDDCGEASASDVDMCVKCGFLGGGRFHRRRIFSLSLGDWLDDEVPVAWLAEMLDTIRQCDQVTWILCSKRWENFQKRLYEVDCLALQNANTTLAAWVSNWRHGQPHHIPKYIIGLCSVENQDAAGSRIKQFLTVPLACRGLSMEPLLGAVMLPVSGDGHFDDVPIIEGISWLIIGGESGANARPCNVDEIRSIVQQSKAAGVPVFVKQLGAAPIEPDPEHDWRPVPNIRDKKGGKPSEWPADLRVQEWPKGF